MAKKLIIVVGIVAILAVTLRAIWYEAFHSTLTTTQAIDLINKEAPIGSDRDHVTAFIDSLTIESLKIHKLGYKLNVGQFEKYIGGFYEKDRQLKYDSQGYMDIRIEDVEHRRFIVYEMDIRFYFDRNDRLIDYDVKEFGDTV